MMNLSFFLALNRMPYVGPRTVLKLLKRWPDLAELFKLSETHLEKEGLPPRLAQTISCFDFKTVNADLRWAEQSDQQLLSWDSSEYPTLLKEIYDPPIILYAKGNLSCLKKQSLAMVGTRKPSIAGSEAAYHFARCLAAKRLSIVSGLALGVDAQAHRGCLAGGGQTLAVMATGMHHIYPARHRLLAEEICQQGLLLTELPLEVTPLAKHFPRRNRIISGLSSAVLVVEAAVKSGSLITAHCALEQNREVLAIPSSIHNPQARGCHHLLQQGARLVTSVSDVLDELGLDSSSTQDKKTENTKLARGNEKLVKCIGFEVTTVDQMVERSGFELKDVICELANLELDGVVKSVSGGYVRC